MTRIAVASLRVSNPGLHILVVCDRDSDDSMRHALDPLIGEVDEWMPVDTPSGAPVFRNRYIKTKLRTLLEGPFIFLDSDVFVRGDLSEIFTLDCDVAAARNHSRDTISEQIWDRDQATLDAMGWKVGSEIYVNGGVLFYNDTEDARRFAAEWHRRWIESSKSRDYCRDQPALNSALESCRPRFAILPDRFNAQVKANPAVAADAMIWHYYAATENSSLHRFEELVRNTMGNGSIDIDAIREMIGWRYPWNGDDVVGLLNEIDALRNQLTSTQAQVARFRRVLADLNNDHGKTLASKSWRITKPLRTLDALFHRLPPVANSHHTGTTSVPQLGYRSLPSNDSAIKVAFAHYSYDADISGVTTWLEKLIVRLHKDGVALSVNLHHFGKNPEKASLLAPLLKAGVSVEVTSRANTLKKDVAQTLGFLNRTQPTVFLPQCMNAHYFAAAIAGEQGLPWVMTIHSDDPDYWAIANARPPTKYGGRSVAVSMYIANFLAERGIDDQVSVVPCGVKIPTRTARFRGTPFQVVYSGRLVETQKRLSLVVKAFIRACEINQSICATIIGDGPARLACRKAIADSGLSHRITLAGRLSPEQVQEKLLDAQAILLMSDFEGLPVAIMEAMAAGVVPVVRNIPSGIPELVRHEQTGLLVDADPESAAQGLSRLASSPALWQECSVAARQLIATRYDEETCYQLWRRLIEKLSAAAKIHYPLAIPALNDLPTHDPILGRGYPGLGQKAVARLKGLIARPA
jgi:glycosyltransferase involved in cell wall biosynthesis